MNIIKKIFISAILISRLLSLDAAAHDNKLIASALVKKSKSSYVAPIIAGAAILAGGYALTNYRDSLQAGLLLSTPTISKLKEFVSENPKRISVCIFAATGISYLSYKLANIWRLQNILNEFPTATHISNQIIEDLTTVEQQELSQFLHADNTLAKGFQLSNPPACMLLRCTEFLRQLPSYMHAVIEKAITDVEISEPIFFYQTQANNHASCIPFPRIGLHPSLLAVFNPELQEIFNNAGFITGYRTEYQNNFFRLLYHELCHIKEKHENFASVYNRIFQEKLQILKSIHANGMISSIEVENLLQKLECTPPANASLLYTLYKEMEAELGATYYLKRLHNIRSDFDYADDNDHPSKEDQNRYNALLLERLDADPATNYTVVQELAKEYILEKEPWFMNFFELANPLIIATKPSEAASSC